MVFVHTATQRTISLYSRPGKRSKSFKMDSVVGRQALLQVGGVLQSAVIRATSRPTSLTSDLSHTEVLLEWDEGEGKREWVCLRDACQYQAVYVESKLVWAKRTVTVEQQRRAVAWPAKAFTLLVCNMPQYSDTMAVEYFCDRERALHHLQNSAQETKELQISQARLTLSRHPYMLMELTEWEESEREHALLLSGQTSLVGRKVYVCNAHSAWPRWLVGVVSTHNQQTKEVTVQEEGVADKSHTVCPLTVHVVLRQMSSGDISMRRLSSQNLQIPHHLSNPNLLLDGGGGAESSPSLLSPHLPSPSIHEASSPPIFPPGAGSLTSACPPPVTAYRTPSIDLHRRTSLHVMDSSLMHSEPNLFRRSSLDPLMIRKLVGGGGGGGGGRGGGGGVFDFHLELTQPGPSLNSAGPSLNSPTRSMQPPPHTSPCGSNTHINRLGSNSRLNEQLASLSPREYMQQERSKSMENINSLQLHSSQAFKRRMSAQVPLSATTLPSKRPRYDLIPSLGEVYLDPPLPPSLHRSMSLSALSHGNKDHSSFGGGGRGNSISNHHDDELDMIKEIIDRDDLLCGPAHHHHRHHYSLTNIPAELSVSLPTLHPPDGLQILNTYESAPAIVSTSNYSSSSSSLHKPSTSSSSLGDTTRHNGSVGDFSAATAIAAQAQGGEKEVSSGFRCESEVFPVGGASSMDHTPFGCSQSPGSARLQPPNSAHLRANPAHSVSKQKASIFNFGMQEANALMSTPPSSHPPTSHPPTSHPHPSLQNTRYPSLCLPQLTEMLRRDTHTPSPSTLLPTLTNPSHPAPQTRHPEPAQIAKEAEILQPEKLLFPIVTDKVGRGGGGGGGVKRGGGEEKGAQGELDIAVIVNQHAPCDNGDHLLPMVGEQKEEVGGEGRSGGKGEGGGEEKSKHLKQKHSTSGWEGKGGGGGKRGRGRPRLTEEEKQRRKELRELGLMKRSHRRSKEEVAQWRAERILSPAKRGRKPGSGKKNVVKAVTGKEVYVSMDLSKFGANSILLQNGFCRAFPGLPKCLDCSTSDGDLPLNRYCRFLEFRKIHIINCTEPLLQVEGFANYTDVQAADLVPWTPLKVGYSRMDPDAALFILRQVAAHFVGVVAAEACTLPEGEVTPIWKRAVKGLRELCDTCDTTLFNFHWVCPHCGFCICPSCHQMVWDLEEGCEDMPMSWLPCASSPHPHSPSSLLLAQIIPANVLADVVSQMLKICETYQLSLEVPCPIQQLVSLVGRQTLQSRFQNDRKGKSSRTRPSKPSDPTNPEAPPLSSSLSSSLPSPLNSTHEKSPPEVLHICTNGRGEPFPPELLHCWLCEGSLLYLLEPSQEENMAAFQHQWRRGLPVVVAGVDKQLNSELWTPRAFGRDFGTELSDLVDCRGGLVLPQCPSHMFWNGFEDMKQRPHDPATGEPRLLKLKDWPPGDDFSEKLPTRFADLMAALPLCHYTRREGKLNMASSLPEFFVKPDMGPKMYNAYGSPAYPSCGTTNLHLDISDAVNVMVYCSIPKGAPDSERQMVMDIVCKECCAETEQRIQSTGAQVGALWHIYAASDTDKIRAFLRKVFEERGLCQPAGTDPIHDQLIYLDSGLRSRLLQEYGVQGWAIAQAVGDAIFIPAGAPHQVRNLCSCIKIAEDFVSPEHIHECLKLTDEFRQLSDRHVNHEDKLQVKNIMYHCIKDIVGILKSTVK